MTRSWSAMLDAVAAMRGASRDDRDVIVASHILWESLHGLVSVHLNKKLGFGLTVHDLAPSVVEGLLLIAGSAKPSRKSTVRAADLPPVRPVMPTKAKRGESRAAR
jgi:hypothetical protein